MTSGFVNACGTSYHPNCFTCRKCGTKLPRSKYYENDNHPYCERCILVINPKATVKGVVSKIFKILEMLFINIVMLDKRHGI